MNNRLSETRMPVPALGTKGTPKSAQPAKQQHEARMSFDQKMRDVEQRSQKKDSDAPRRASTDDSDLPDNKRISDKGESSDNGLSDSGKESQLASLTIDMPAAKFDAAVTAVQQASAPLLNEAQIAHLDRMAAAIAEAVASGDKDVFTLDFGMNTAVAKSAIISRDAAGMVTINLVTPNASIQPQGWMLLRNQLMDRLEKRRIALKGLTLDEDDNKDAANPVNRKT
jgi:hypothetical protein